MKKLAALPRIRKNKVTAYELAQKVVEVVEAEPKRLLMDGWGHRFTVAETADNSELPRCGTVACIGGWVGVIATGKISTGSEAIDLLVGFARSQTSLELENCFYRFPKMRKGTSHYATSALRPFRAWIETHREELQARVIDLREYRR